MADAPHGDDTDTTIEAPVRPARGARTEALDAGTTIGRYVVEGALGHGGMSTIYRAYDPELGRRVAIKLLRVGGRGPESNELRRARLMREAHALAQLAHPNVVAVFDAGVHGEQVFVAMELIEGPSLRDWLAAARRSRAQIVAAFCDVGRGLAAAHRAGIVHRDVKPDNAVVGADGRVRVLDFGLARLDDQPLAPSSEPDASEDTLDVPVDAAPLTRVGVVVGTPSYMSPEQHQGFATGPAGDQWSFCASLWEALGGAPPFGRGSLDEIRQRVVEGPPPPLPRRARVPRRLERALRRGLAVAPTARWPSMLALVEELERLRRPRRWPWLVAAGAVVAALVTWRATAARRPAAPPCADPAPLLVGAWDPDLAARIERAFAATGASYAPSTFARVRAGLDEVAAAWRRGHADACAATKVRHEQSPEVLDRRMACLASRRRELSALTEVFASADQRVVEHAIEATGSLISPDVCGDLERLDRGGAAPSPAATPIVDALAHAVALRAAGRFDDAHRRAAAALADATAARLPALAAEAAWRVAQLDVDLGRLDVGAAGLLDAGLAAEAAGRDDVVFETLLGRLGLLTDEHGAGDDGRELVRRAAAVLTRVGQTPDRQARLARIESIVAMTEGDTATALARAEAAVALATRAWPARHPELLAMRRWRAAVLDRAGRHDDAAVELGQVIADLRQTLGDEHPELARALVAQSILAGDRLDYDLAERAAAEALRIRVVALGDDHPEVGLTLTTLGVARMWKHDVAHARADFERALAILARTPATHHLASGALANLGDVALSERAWDEAERRYRAALAIDEVELGATHPDLALDLIGLADALVEQPGRAAEALAAVERALGLLRGEPRALAEGQFTTARCLALLGRDRARALTLARTARAFFAQAPAQHAAELAQIDAWLARAR